MTGRQWLGVALWALGAVLIVVAVMRLAGGGNPPTAEASPSASASTPTEAPTPTPVPTPVPTPTPVPSPGEADVRAFVEVLVTAIQTGDVETLTSNLHPAVVDRYGEPACRSAVATFTNPEFDIEVLEVQDQAAWDYVTDELTTSIPDAWPVPGNLSVAAGQPSTPMIFHFAPHAGTVRWFTDCGTPL